MANPLPGRCPVCANALTVTRLQCGNCGTAIEGAFGLGRLQALTPEQMQFVETFIKCRGKIKDVEVELGISYPTVVARLNEVVRSMGYEVDDRDISEVDQYEMYQAQMLNPKAGGQRGLGGQPSPVPPMPLMTPVSPVQPMSPMSPVAPTVPAPSVPPARPGKPRLTAEQKQQILDDLEAGRISTAEAMEKLNG